MTIFKNSSKCVRIYVKNIKQLDLVYLQMSRKKNEKKNEKTAHDSTVMYAFMNFIFTSDVFYIIWLSGFIPGTANMVDFHSDFPTFIKVVCLINHNELKIEVKLAYITRHTSEKPPFPSNFVNI